MKTLFGFALLLVISTSAFAAPVFTDIAKNADGSVKFMGQAQAILYCLSQGAHLPSARELTFLATSAGAEGLVDSCSRTYKCYLYTAISADGKSDDFVFSYLGYKRPLNEFGNNWLWSSSAVSNVPGYGLFLQGDNGKLKILAGKHLAAATCVLGR